jgi:FixJ family two-component response regulator
MSNMQKQTVFVVDDDAAVRDSIAELVESIGLQAEGYASALAFLEAFQPERPGCLVLDVRMAEMSGLALQQRLNALVARIPVIVLTGHGDVPMAVQAMRNGAVDFIQKPYREQALLDSINAALALDAAARLSSSAADDLDQRLTALTEREQEVLSQTLSGSTSKEIARELGVSHRTVEAHRQNLLRKLGTGTVKELMRRLGFPGSR